MNEFERMFAEEIRDKKRIGRGIFSRKSTRKGGSNKPLKTPYYYMTNKERQALNGKVKVYGMEDIISYEEFMDRDVSEQLRLMSIWKQSHKKVDIHRSMGISSSTFYRLLDNLEESQSGSDVTEGGIVVTGKPTQESIDEFKESMISYKDFRSKSNPEKNEVISNYLQFFGTVAELSRNWESSDISYLYSVAQRVKKREEKQARLLKEQRAKEAKEQRERKQTNKSKSDKYQSLKETMASMPEKPSEETRITLTDEENRVNNHKSNVNISTETLSFALDGHYSGEHIARLLSLASEVITTSNGMLKIELKITQGEN